MAAIKNAMWQQNQYIASKFWTATTKSVLNSGRKGSNNNNIICQLCVCRMQVRICSNKQQWCMCRCKGLIMHGNHKYDWSYMRMHIKLYDRRETACDSRDFSTRQHFLSRTTLVQHITSMNQIITAALDQI